jgi:hypothetical protein
MTGLFLEKEMPISKRLFIALGFLGDVKPGIVQPSVSHRAPRKARAFERPNVCSLGITNVGPLRGQVRGWWFFYKSWASQRPSIEFKRLN